MGRAQNVPGPSLGRALWGITLGAFGGHSQVSSGSKGGKVGGWMEGSRELYQRKNRLVLRSVGWIGSFLLAQDAGGWGGNTSHSLGLTVAGSWGHLAYCPWLWGDQLGSALWGRGEREGT